ncbi:MAG: hypothetical protein HYU46_06460 [Deltaproteobacteria bacterium]|nr:hypothetical protein [Deltaproteobacteria bacterium]
MKLIRADINPPGDFDLSEDLPRFSQGSEPPLNLTEKVNRVVMDRMRAARNNSKDERRTTHKTSDTKGKKPMRNSKGSEKPPKTGREITAKDSPAEINNQIPGSDGLRENASKQSATQLDSSKVQSSPELFETSEESGPRARDQKQSEKLDWISTWDED